MDGRGPGAAARVRVASAAVQKLSKVSALKEYVYSKM
jgi:hypothetical protein